jgi:hypothetical protein
MLITFLQFVIFKFPNKTALVILALNRELAFGTLLGAIIIDQKIAYV